MNKKLAESYYKLLKSLDWEDEVLLMGLGEGLRKFLSNASLRLSPGSKYFQGDYYSSEAADKVKRKDLTNLIYEHMVPGRKYIQIPCEERARKGNLSVEFVKKLLDNYWKIAIITKEEDRRLNRSRMPENWDGKDIFLRYTEAGLDLVSREAVFGSQPVAGTDGVR